ncbi:nuclear transport factor 2 family protein [Myxosarcina sp. GI1]|uniref:nuclear transport factor 2 family protein n=1 Tax=Myxosarcina sp. GI1 TaxID=1541065 RepID=UPI0005667D07|nr:nuclear transport factor 2 family protein [Myxosarcina sp. GI1]
MKILANMKNRLFKYNWSIALLLGLGIWGVSGSLAEAQTADAPKKLQTIISEIEAAANDKDISAVMEYYSSEYTNTDGLSRSSLSQALSQMWEDYSNLNYTTTIESWENNGNELVAETSTKISGTKNNQGRDVRLDSTLRSRQYFQDGKIIRQEILSEETKLTSGQNPPQIEVFAPKTVETGEQYNFDVVVTEPLQQDVLLGAVEEERTTSDRYLNPTALELQPLSAGGIYKLVTAPLLPDSNWLSTILVRGDGITMFTQRVNVEERGAE